MSIFFHARLIAFLLFILLISGCATPTHTVDLYPNESDPQHNTTAYQAKDGTTSPATESDAALSAGFQILHKLFRLR